MDNPGLEDVIPFGILTRAEKRTVVIQLSQSRRDFVLQPRVGRILPDYPGLVQIHLCNPIWGCAQRIKNAVPISATTPLGLNDFLASDPRVVPLTRGQPWAGGRNPFGILTRTEKRTAVIRLS